MCRTNAESDQADEEAANTWIILSPPLHYKELFISPTVFPFLMSLFVFFRRDKESWWEYSQISDYCPSHSGCDLRIGEYILLGSFDPSGNHLYRYECAQRGTNHYLPTLNKHGLLWTVDMFDTPIRIQTWCVHALVFIRRGKIVI